MNTVLESDAQPALILCIDDDDIVLRVRRLLLGRTLGKIQNNKVLRHDTIARRRVAWCSSTRMENAACQHSLPMHGLGVTVRQSRRISKNNYIERPTASLLISKNQGSARVSELRL